MMSFRKQFLKDRGERNDLGAAGAGLGADDGALHGPELDRALRDFRSSVHAWSDAASQRPRLVDVTPQRISLWKTASWVLGSVLVVGGVGGGLLEYRHQQEQAHLAGIREAEHQRQIEEQRAREAEQELAQVDSDVSREVPAALEPLGQLMTADDNQ